MRYYIYYKNYNEVAKLLSKREVVDIHTYKGELTDNIALHDSNVQILDINLSQYERSKYKNIVEIQRKKKLKVKSLVDFNPDGIDYRYNQPSPNPWSRLYSDFNTYRLEYYNPFDRGADFSVEYTPDGQYETGHLYGDKKMINPNQFYHGIVSMWERGVTGKGVKIAVIDTGYSGLIPHRDIQIVDTYNFYAGDTKEYIDDEHAFQMIGLAGARSTNLGGVVGNAYEADIYSASFFNPGASISWANQQGCQVYNCSFDAGEPDLYFARAVKKAIADGGIVVAAAGNARSSLQAQTGLASMNGVVSVAALVGGATVKFQEVFYTKSILTTKNKPIDFALPHWAITCQYLPQFGPTTNLYKITGGSSSAAAQLSGIFALLFQAYPYLTGTDIVNLLKSKSKSFTDLGVTALIPKLDW